MTQAHIPVITIDGPTASGKGTVAQRVAAVFGFHYLDSGALYRICALAALRAGTALDDPAALARLAHGLVIDFTGPGVSLDGEDVKGAIREENVGRTASAIAVFPELRAALVARQLAFRQEPGLVADGRDMGTVLFPDALLKVFLVASVEARAQRRTNQLKENGIFANITTLLQDLQERDRRDSERAAAPLVAAPDAVVIDSSDLGIAQVVDRIVMLAGERGFQPIERGSGEGK
jgi:cytidylate kinase